MLVISRQIGEAIYLGDGTVKIVVLDVKGKQVKLGIEAPDTVSIKREELYGKTPKGRKTGKDSKRSV